MIEPPIQVDRAPVTRRIGAVRREPGMVFWRRVPSAGRPAAPRSARSAPATAAHRRSISIHSRVVASRCADLAPASESAARASTCRYSAAAARARSSSARAAREPASSRWCRRCRSLPAISPAVSRRVRASAGPARPSSRARPARTASAALNRSATAARSLASARSRSSNRSRLPAATSCRADARCARPVAATRRPRACVITDSREVTGSRGAVCRYGQGVQPDIPPPR